MADALSWLQQLLGGEVPPSSADQAPSDTGSVVTQYLQDVLSGKIAAGSPMLQNNYDPNASFAENVRNPAGIQQAMDIAMGIGPGALRLGGRAPAIITPTEGALDYRGINMAERPDVPQFLLNRPPPPARGLSERWTTLDNPETWARYQEGARRGLPEEGQSGGREWYNTLPLQRAFTEINPDTGAPDFRRYIDYVGASSPENRVPSNARTASYLYFADKQGLDLPTLYPGVKGSTSIYPADVKAVLFPKDPAGIELPSGLTRAEEAAIKAQYGLPPGYGGKAQTDWIQHALNIREGTGFDLMTNPKPPSFTQNLLGNYMPLTIDRHNMRLVAPGLGDTPPRNAYGYLEGLQNRYAGDLGLDPAQAQAATWLGGDTGVKSSLSLPFVGEFEQQLNRAAQAARISPREMLRDFVLGNRPL